MVKVLVLLATFNGEKYLQEQLDSLYAQENVDVYVLVRDDGSSDRTIEILRDNEEHHHLSWYQGEHVNVDRGFFELMKEAGKTEFNYYAFCDQDDVWDRNKLQIAYDAIKDIKVPALYYSGQRLVDENLGFISNHKLNNRRTFRTRFVLSDFAGCTGFFNRALLKKVLEYEPKYLLMHDAWVLRVCLSIGGTVVVDPEPRISYRQHAHNVVGLGNGFKAKMRQVYNYLCIYHIELLTQELVNGYWEEMIPEYKELASWICSYKKNVGSKIQLLDFRNINFYSLGLNITYWVKVFFNLL